MSTSNMRAATDGNPERGDGATVRRPRDEQSGPLASRLRAQLRPLVPNGATAPTSAVASLGDVVRTARVVGPMRAWMLCSLSLGPVVERAGRATGG